MSGYRILGIGSPLGADRAGWAVAEAAAEKLGERTTCECLDRPGANLVERLEEANDLILVDAMRAGLGAGEVRQLSRGEMLTGGPLLSSHGLGVAQALELARALGVVPEGLRVFGVEVADLAEWPAGLTEPAATALLARLSDPGHFR